MSCLLLTRWPTSSKKTGACVQLFATPWTVVHQVPLSMEFSKQEYWNGLPFPTPGHLPTKGLNPSVSWRRKWQLTPVFLLGKSHGQRSLVGYSPWGCKRVGHDLATKQQQIAALITPILKKKILNSLDTARKIIVFFGRLYSHLPLKR